MKTRVPRQSKQQHTIELTSSSSNAEKFLRNRILYWSLRDFFFFGRPSVQKLLLLPQN